VAAPDEAELDAILLSLLDGGDEAVADLFLERTVTHEACATVSCAGAPPPRVMSRLDEGAGLRRVTKGGVAAAHVSGWEAGALRRAARSLRAGEPMDGPTPPVPITDAGAPGGNVTGLLLAARAHADRLLAREGQVLGIDLAAAVSSRAVHVVSSEWGHVRERSPWASLHVSLHVACGGSRATVRRGRGVARSFELEAWVADGGLERLLEDALAGARALGEARDVPRGAPAVVLAPGAGGVLVHEAVGHGLEADVVARGASLFGGMLGERVAPAGLTVVDDPLLPGLAGSRAHDDEGAPSRAVPLIDQGVLAGVLTDGLRSGFDPARASGHGRRASFREPPLPRMTNTHVLPGSEDAEDLVRGVADGLYVRRLERAAADPQTGDVQFLVTEGARIERGRLTHAVRDVTLSGNALAILRSMDGVAADVAWDDGLGTCGREGQWVPVALGQPTLRLLAGVLTLG
jgi:TldD protein